VGHVADRPDDLPHPVPPRVLRRLLHPAETARRFIEYPGYNGGTDWGGIAVDPTRGVIVANYNDMPNYNRLIPRAEVDRRGWVPRGERAAATWARAGRARATRRSGTPYGIRSTPAGACPSPAALQAAPVRRYPRHRPAHGSHPVGPPPGHGAQQRPVRHPSMLPINIGTPNNGGAVVTAGGLSSSRRRPTT
jgi:quinoprotein glucose dehydrogenase